MDSDNKLQMQEPASVDKFEPNRFKHDELEQSLRGHISQLLQSISQLSLKPGDEEIRKRAGGNFGYCRELL